MSRQLRLVAKGMSGDCVAERVGRRLERVLVKGLSGVGVEGVLRISLSEVGCLGWGLS